MKILVVDDDKRHHESAKKLLGEEHDLTIVSNPDKAVEMLEPQFDEQKEAQLLKAAGFPKGFNTWDKSVSKEERERYWAEYKKAHAASEIPFPFDAVLLDLLMPATTKAMGREGEKLAGQLMPYGYSLAFLAIQRGAKLVGILTETNHHMHPMSAALDPLRLGNVMTIDQAKFALIREYSTTLVHEDIKCPECGGTGKGKDYQGNPKDCYDCKGTGHEHVRAKDWKLLLGILTGEPVDEPETSTSY